MNNDRARSVLSPPDVVGPGEVCALLEIGRESFRRHHKSRADFPPAQHLECGDVYERRAIIAYAQQRATGRPYLATLALYRRNTATDPRTAFAATARDVDVSPTTIRRYLRQLGEIA